MTREQIEEIRKRARVREGLVYVELSPRERDALCDLASATLSAIHAKAESRCLEMGMRLAEVEAQLTAALEREKAQGKWAVFCALCGDKWEVTGYHPGKSICESCEKREKAER